MTVIPAIASALRTWSPGLYFPAWPADRSPLVPWLAPDGRELGARRRLIRPPFVPASLRDRCTDAGQLVRARRSSLARACRLSIDLIGAGPIGRAALWSLYR